MFSRRLYLGVIALIIGAVLAADRCFANDAFQTTTELGVTVTANDILDAMEESSSFWPAVRRYIVSSDFKAADQVSRIAADRCIGQVQDQLYNRLMGGDDAAAMDVIHYITWSIRRNHFLRELRDTVGDAEAVGRLRSIWCENFSSALGRGTIADLQPLAAQMEPRLKLLGLPNERQTQVLSLWRSLGTCMLQLEETQTGKLLRETDRTLAGRPEADLVRRIVTAADWACAMKTHSGPAVRADFISAWDLFNRPAGLASSPVGR